MFLGSSPSSQNARLARPHRSLSRIPLDTCQSISDCDKRLNEIKTLLSTYHGGLQPLKAVAATARPLDDFLFENKRQVLFVTQVQYPSTSLPLGPVSTLSHLPQVQYKSVSFVETLPADRNLRCPDHMATFDLQQPSNLHIVGHHMLKPRGHATFLWDNRHDVIEM